MRKVAFALAGLLLASCAGMTGSSTPAQPKFHSIFDGKTLNGWTMKVANYPLGENPHNMWTVEPGGIMRITFDGFDTFTGEYAHVFYKKPLHNYILRLEYRFNGTQAKGGQSWATRNSGVMLFAQPPETMDLKQSYPISVEDQLLGGLGTGPRKTLAVCMVNITPQVDGQNLKSHCTTDVGATSQTFDGNQWVKLEIHVENGDVKSYANGVLANHFNNPHVDAAHPWQTTQDIGTTLSYFTLQGESDEVEFRNIELAELP